MSLYFFEVMQNKGCFDILFSLKNGAKFYTTIRKEMNLDHSKIAYYIRRLKEAGLIENKSLYHQEQNPYHLTLRGRIAIIEIEKLSKEIEFIDKLQHDKHL